MTGTPIPTLAAEEFRERQAKASALVAQARWRPEQAEQKLRPWLAIACLAGADLPELAGQLAERRRVVRYPGAQDGVTTATNHELRACLAADLCHRKIWVLELAAARTAALDRWALTPTDPDLTHRTRRLQALADHLAHDPAGLHHLPPYLPKSGQQNQEQAA